MKKVIRTPDFPIVQIRTGKLHGYQEDRVYHFPGIRYGRARRFEMPEPETKWDGIRDAKAYGCVCPLLPEENHPEDDPSSASANSFEMPHRYWPKSENCLYLNIWTKHISEKANKPVMVWLHGGGYSNGSSVEIPAYDGHNLCDYGDVVVVNLNHRLNCIGFLDLSEFGEKYKYSGIVGMADIVLALQWVHDNISAFGGDPENVTVAGQSGGGGKAAALLQMPMADGLYTRIIIESGAFRCRSETNEENKLRWQTLGEKTAGLLGLNKDNIDEIRNIPYEKLASAAVKAGKELGYQGGMMLFEPSPTEGYYTGLYNEAGFRDETKNIPIICGNVLGEFSFMHFFGDKLQYTEEEKLEILRQKYGKDTDRILKLFKKIYSGKDILYALGVDALFRPGAVEFINKRISYTNAPVFNYILSIIYPYLGGIVPWHCAEIPLVFRNTDMEPLQCTCWKHLDKLTDEISNSWLAFMKSGNPSSGALDWKPYTSDYKGRMVFDTMSGMTDKDDQELLRLVSEHGFIIE